MTTIFVYPSDPLNPRLVDEEFRDEANLVKSLGGTVVMVDHTDIQNGVFTARNVLSANKASEFDHFLGTEEERQALLPAGVPAEVDAIYRGWMLTPDEYQFMRWQLGIRLIELISDTADYAYAHMLPNWFFDFEDFTANSISWPRIDDDDANLKSWTKQIVGNGPFFVKGFVKSLKHEDPSASYAENLDALPATVRKFRDLQGDDFDGGIVIREFEDFDKELGEVRVWWVNGQPVLKTPHPDTPDLLADVDVSFLTEQMKKYGRKFVTTDLARRKDGVWRVVEVGDGQVSGLPKGVDATPLFEALLALKWHYK